MLKTNLSSDKSQQSRSAAQSYDVISPLQNKSPILTLKSEMCRHIYMQIIKHINDVQS